MMLNLHQYGILFLSMFFHVIITIINAFSILFEINLIMSKNTNYGHIIYYN